MLYEYIKRNMFTGQNPYLLERTSVHIQETLKTGKKWFPKRRGHIIVILKGTEEHGRKNYYVT
jgi:hypothetical protein